MKNLLAKLLRLIKKTEPSKILTKNIVLLCIAVLMLSVSTFAWFTIGNPDFGFNSGVIKYPEGVSVGFVSNDTDLEGGKIEFENVLPLTSIKIAVQVKKPLDKELRVSLKILNMVAPLDSNGNPLDDIFKMFILRHNISGVDFAVRLYDIRENESGYFLTNYLIGSGKEEEIFNFEIYFTDTPPEGEDIDNNKFQGLSMKIGILELEIIYK